MKTSSYLLRLGKLQIAAGLLAGLNLFLSSTASASPLPNTDNRLNPAKVSRPMAIDAAKENAASLIGQRVKDVRIDRDAILGSPSFIASPSGFLTGANGSGGAVSVGTAAAFSANDPERGVKTFLTEHLALFGFGPEALAAARVNQDYVSAPGNFRTLVWQQQVDDIPVLDGIFKAHLTKNGELINVGSLFVPSLQSALGKIVNRASQQSDPPISAHRAIVLAAENLGDVLTTNQITSQDTPQGNEKFQHFRGFPVLNNTSARLTWLPLDASTVRLCWDISLESRARGELYRVIVDAATGEVWVRRCLTENLSNIQMNVWTGESPAPLSPALGSVSSYQPPVVARSLVTFAALDTTASPLGWINDGDNTTAGNNADAHLDWDNNNIIDPGSRATGSPYRVFNFPIDLTTQQPRAYSNAVVASLFYWNNWAHDKFYELGFTEAAGNFQNERFGHGGYPGSAVQADGQDSYDSTNFNNANFSTPVDGTAPRMQMYIFTGPSPDRDGSLDAGVMLHEYTHGVSSRLVGGGVGIYALQTEGMGEGWSDFCALSLLSNPANDPNANYTVGSYIEYQDGGLTNNYYFGFRRYPYSVNTSINPLTFKDIDTNQISPHVGVPFNPTASSNPTNANEVHYMGEVWCNTLLEARARLIARLGSAAGNAQMLQLVIDGMKLTSTNPDFLEARNAIMQADLVDTGGSNLNDLWIAFAKRGMGFNANSPGASTTEGVIQNFDLPLTSNYPFIAITGPTEESFHSSSPTVTGVADSSVLQVWIYLQRVSDELYYNPTNGTWVAPPVPIMASGIANWSVTLPSLADGFYLIGANAHDGVNLATKVYRYFTMDTTKPTLSISSPVEGAAFALPPLVTGGVKDNYWVQDVHMVLERGTDGAYYNFASNTWGTAVFDAARNNKSATVMGTNWTATLPPLTDGFYDVQVQAADRAANTTTWSVRHFAVDTVAPTITFAPLTNQQSVFNFAQLGGTISKAGTVKFKIEWFIAGGANQFWNGVNWSSDGSDGNALLLANIAGLNWTPANGTLPSRAQTAQGNYLIHAFFTDTFGNTNDNSIVLARSPLDTTPPIATINIFEGQEFTNTFLPPVLGQAVDGESGVDLVTMYFSRRVPGGFEYWNGSSWSGTASLITLSYSNLFWGMPGGTPQPSGANLQNASYNIQVIARNQEVPALSGSVSVNFTVDYHPIYVFTAGSYVDPDQSNNNMRWDNPANWDVGLVPPVDCIVVINAYQPDNTALGNVSLYRLDLSGGTLTTVGMSLQKFNLSGGTLSGGAITIATNGVFNLSGDNVRTLSGGAMITSGGAGTWSGTGLLNVAANSKWINNGTLTVLGDATVYNNTGGGSAFFTNNGTFLI